MEQVVDTGYENVKTHRENNQIEPGSSVSPKLDGIYARANRKGIFTKSGRKILTQPHLNHSLKPFFAKHPTSELHGELYKHGQKFEKTLSDFQGGGGKLQYHLFPHNPTKPKVSKTIRHVKGQQVATQHDADAHYKASVKAGYEGQVVQAPTGELKKRKPQHDEEYEVTHAAMGKKHGILTVRDTAGRSFKVQAPSAEANQSSIGKPVTVAYVRKTRNGVPHAPVYKGTRDYDMGARIHRLIAMTEKLDTAFL